MEEDKVPATPAETQADTLNPENPVVPDNSTADNFTLVTEPWTAQDIADVLTFMNTAMVKGEFVERTVYLKNKVKSLLGK